MTREELLEKRRKAFEAATKKEHEKYGIDCYLARLGKGYDNEIQQASWWAWNAALDSVVIELPSAFEDEFGHLVIDNDDVIDSIELQGYKVKP